MKWCIVYLCFTIVVSIFRWIWFLFDKKGIYGLFPSAICWASLLTGVLLPIILFITAIPFNQFFWIPIGTGVFISMCSLIASLSCWNNFKQRFNAIKSK